MTQYEQKNCAGCHAKLIVTGKILHAFDVIWGRQRFSPPEEVQGITVRFHTHPMVCSDACREFVLVDPTWVTKFSLDGSNPISPEHVTRFWSYAEGYQSFELPPVSGHVPEDIPTLPATPVATKI